MSKPNHESSHSDGTPRVPWQFSRQPPGAGAQPAETSGSGTPRVPYAFAIDPGSPEAMTADSHCLPERGGGSGTPTVPWWFDIQQPNPPTAARGEPLPQDGRYRLANSRLELDLRIDIGGSNIVSADLFVANVCSERHSRIYLASLRNRPGLALSTHRLPLPIVVQDGNGRRAQGELDVVSNAAGLAVGITIDAQVNGLPAGQVVILSGHFEGPQMRTLGLELESEVGVTTEPVWEIGNRVVTVESCLRDAGFDLHSTGRRTRIDVRVDKDTWQGWDDSQLHTLMTLLAQARIDRPEWQMQALMLTRPSLAGLNGVMFDTGDDDLNDLPRQGFALFEEEIRTAYDRDGNAVERWDWQRKTIQTFIHELGHGLNLAHRFEREVGRANSASFMNYDWKYLGGNNAARFWQDFDFQFDADELAFLRHGPHPQVIPGGAEFHTVPYWENTAGGYVPYRGEVPTQDLSLTLQGPGNPAVFAFGQPVLLAVTLTNNTRRDLELPDFMLDPKAGFLQVQVQRLRAGVRQQDDAASFQPLVHRCMDIARQQDDRVAPGGKLVNNINLTFGAAGFTFMEPGNYLVTATLSIPINRDYAWHVRAQPLRMRIKYPQGAADERMAMDLFRADVGRYLALGGSQILTGARDILQEIAEQRGDNLTDPLVLNIHRCQAIGAMRPRLDVKDGQITLTASAQAEEGKQRLKALVKSAPGVLDAASVQQLKRPLRRKLPSSRGKG